MSGTLDARKAALLDELFAQARSLPSLDGVDLEPLIRTYYKHVAPEDVIDRSSRDLGATVLHHLGTAGNRPQGTAVVRLMTPLRERDGWSVGGRTIVEVVTDDMPFLVDSVSMALDAAGHDVHVLIHPLFVVRRGVDGELREVLADDAGATDPHDVERESWMHVEIDRLPDDELDAVRATLLKVLQDVREAVEDWPRMHHQVHAVADELAADPPPLPAEEVEETRAFLLWLADNHFTFLGYREYDLVEESGEDRLRAVPGTGYGILRADPTGGPDAGRLPDVARRMARDKTLLVLAKANSRATVHRSVHLDYVGVKKFDAAGEVSGERRFLGLFSSGAYTESVTRIPMLREKAQRVIALAGYEPMSHAGKAVMDVLETYPRDELFQTPAEDLVRIADAVAQTRERRQLRLFLRRDTYGRYLSCLVYLPRDRYNTTVRERISAILKQRLDAESVDFTARVTESFAARLQFVARPAAGQELTQVDPAELEAELATAARSWTDDLAAAVLEQETDDGPHLVRQYSDAFPEAYKEDYSPATGAEDLCRLVAMGADDLHLLLTPQTGSPTGGDARLKIYRTGASLSLSEVLPMLSAMGVEIIDERPYSLDGLPQATHIYDFGLRYHRPWPDAAIGPFQETIEAVWRGQAESDSFNALVLSAGLTWRQTMLLRAYARYLRQGNTPYSQEYIEDTLAANVDITGYLVQLFEARFDPGRNGLAADAESRVAKCEELVTRVARALDDVVGLDQDRILRSYLALVQATLRTNYYQLGADGEPHPYLSLKLEPSAIPDLPEPRPRFEIFVYSPRVEGVHLRFGAVARGGLRWSDRRDDFRTEVLGLVKAQMVKNTVIVPVGAKGGFVCKQLPDPGDRDAWMAEGVRCYRTFISALLDVTDNLVHGAVVPPSEVVRHDGDDSYLVVAADKGTATFSDIANDVALSYGFWLGDAFASGGSVGYDHKAMGITARGAWVSVQRHFRERGIDCQTQDFTAVGIGDMSGDVFGNGLLCSEHTRLVAAFDHRDIFLDPDPDPASSFAERKRLFDLPRSSWQDYDRDLISAGGGVHSRSTKSVPISSEVRAALGLADDVAAMSPPDLMRAILLAPVDLLWNGGIGTYVKSADETDAQAGDKANDAIRVNGRDLRASIVGEGGNLGLTQLGRIEYALAGCGGAGGRLNTDFIDNSAGVDTSDHEVNIKILLDRVVAGQIPGVELSQDDRNTLLASMTDEVGSLVLADNYEQNLALANSMFQAPALLHVHESWMRQLEADGRLNRALEALPSRREVAGRIERGEGLTDPELSVLLAYAKIGLAEDLLTTDLADDPFLRNDLYSYFPHAMRQDYRSAMEAHPLRREIIVTQIVNDLVNGAGISFLHRLGGETGASTAELTRANFIAREVFGTAALLREINANDGRVDAAVQTRARLEVRTLAERVTRWLVNNRRPPLDSEEIVDHFDVMTQRVLAALPELMTGRERTAYDQRRDELVEQGLPADLSARVAAMPPAYMIIGIVETASRDELDPLEVARVHFALGERLGLPTLVARILALPRTDRWETMARAALRDDLHGVHAQIVAQVLAATPSEQPAARRVFEWESADDVVVARAVSTLEEIVSDEHADLARLSVGLRVVRSLLS